MICHPSGRGRYHPNNPRGRYHPNKPTCTNRRSARGGRYHPNNPRGRAEGWQMPPEQSEGHRWRRDRQRACAARSDGPGSVQGHPGGRLDGVQARSRRIGAGQDPGSCIDLVWRMGWRIGGADGTRTIRGDASIASGQMAPEQSEGRIDLVRRMGGADGTRTIRGVAEGATTTRTIRGGHVDHLRYAAPVGADEVGFHCKVQKTIARCKKSKLAPKNRKFLPK